MSAARRLLSALATLVLPRGRTTTAPRRTVPKGGARPGPARSTADAGGVSPGAEGATATVAVRRPGSAAVRISYAPDRDGAPDAGEVVWTWVPYAENDGRGKDRPVLVIGRHAVDRVWAVRLTSTPHDGDSDFVALGTGPWDGQGRPSWVDVSQLYSVHDAGMRREAAELDVDRFTRVAVALQRRYGWAVAD